MDWSSPHLGFVVAAYALSFAVLAGLVLYILRRDRRLETRLRSIDRRGRQ